MRRIKAQAWCVTMGVRVEVQGRSPGTLEVICQNQYQLVQAHNLPLETHVHTRSARCRGNAWSNQTYPIGGKCGLKSCT